MKDFSPKGDPKMDLTMCSSEPKSGLPARESGRCSLPIARAPRSPVPPLRGDLFADGGLWMVDRDNRVVIPRGVNFSGTVKLPTTPDGATNNRGGLRPGQAAESPTAAGGLLADLEHLADWPGALGGLAELADPADLADCDWRT
eukprot:gene12756-biopygen12048